ncbi:MAG: hypothetical protein ACOCV3_06810 [Halanaerobiales bacterium]
MRNRGPKDLPQNELPEFNLSKLSRKNEEKNVGNLNPRCSRYQARSDEFESHCPTTLTSSMHEVLSHSDLDQVLDKLYDLKYRQKVELMDSDERKELLNFMFGKINYRNREQLQSQINNIFGINVDLENKEKINKVINKINFDEENKLVELIYSNLDKKAREKVVERLKATFK